MNLSHHADRAPAVISLPKTSKEVEAELKNPNSLLSQDLYNAFMNALLRKKERRHMELRYAIEQVRQRKMDELEQDDLERRKQAKAAQDQNWKEYYAENDKIARQSLDLLAAHPLPISFESFSVKAQELVLVQAQLLDLHRARESLLEQKQQIQSACIEGIVSALDSGKIYTMPDGQQLSLDISQLPETRQQEIRNDEHDVLGQRVSREPRDTVVANYNRFGVGKGSTEEALLDQITLMYVLRNRVGASTSNANGGSTIKYVANIIMPDFDPIMAAQRREKLRLEALLRDNSARINGLEQTESVLAASLGLASPAAAVMRLASTGR